MSLRAARRLPALLVVVALALAGCAALAPSRAELVVDVRTEDGAATAEVLEAASRVLAGRLADAGIPTLEAVVRDGAVVVRFGDEADADDLAAAEELVVLSSTAEFREVLHVAACPEGDLPAPVAGGELVLCGDDVLHELGPAEIDGARIDTAEPVHLTGNGLDTWAVDLVFDAEGTEAFAAMTERLLPDSGWFALVVDGEVVIAPQVNAVVTDGRPQISGGFDETAARVLAARFRLAGLEVVTSATSLTVLD